MNFQDGQNCGQLGFLIGTVLAIVINKVTPMLSSRFRVNWPFGSGKEAKNRFSWISDWNDFSYF